MNWIQTQVVVMLLVVCMRSNVVLCCPTGCECTVAKEAGGETGKKNVVCRGKVNMKMYTSIDQLRPNPWPEDTLYLTLSGFAFKSLKKDAFQGPTKLLKLDLSDNELESIEPGAFSGLDQLEKLNLSSNNLGSINSSMFEGLTRLERLYLNDNQIKSLPKDCFNNLTQLQKVEFSSPYLVCDCHLAWIKQWMKNFKVKTSATTCALPSDMKGKIVRKLNRADLHCDRVLELPVFKLTPSSQQVVFQGDKLPFLCHASATDPETDVYWQRNHARVHGNVSTGILVHTEDQGHTVTSRLVLDSVESEDSGVWTCVVQTPRGNVSKSVTITVIPHSATFCPPVTRHTNKGILHWPKTIAGLNRGVPCPHGKAANFKPKFPSEHAQALHSCTLLGEWATLSTEQCQYESEVTRILQQYAQTDLRNVSGDVERWADMLMAYLGAGGKSSPPLTDHMDVVYLSHIVDTLSKQVTPKNKLADVLLHIVGVVMTSATDTALTLAQHEHYALTSLVSSVERLGPLLLSPGDVRSQRFARHVTIEVVRPWVSSSPSPGLSPSFPGVSCSVERPPYKENSLMCAEGGYGNSSSRADNTENLEASIHLPSTAIEDAECLLPATSCNDSSLAPVLQFIAYSNAKLFPTEAGFQITSPVLSASIVGHILTNSTSPVVLRLPAPKMSSAGPRVVYWDAVSRYWKQDGCRLEEADDAAGSREFLIAHCDHLTQFGLMTPVSVGSRMEGGSWLSEYFTMNPIVYAGSTVLLLCLTITILTYILCNSELKMPRKVRHCIPNLCFALLLLVVTFSFGARTTDPPLACQIVGIGLHYFSLCTLFWITIFAYVLYKQLSKANRPPPPPNPEPSEGPPQPKPILGLYLLGWGLAVIACGIVAAISLGHYTQHGHDYCFLAPEPRLLAFYAPVGLLAIVNIFLFFCMCHNVRRASANNTALDPDTEEVTDIEEAESAVAPNPLMNASRSVASDDSIEDLEYRPVSQLRAVVVLLFLYATVWASGGFAVALPYPSELPYQELIFTVLYAISSAGLGIFIVVFYVFARRDCRTCWQRVCGCRGHVPEYEVSNVRHVNGTSAHSNHVPPIHTTSSSIESHSIKSNNSRMNGGLKYSAAPLLPPPQTNGHLTDSSITQDSFPNFYNPKQNGMARKYWQKKRQKNLITQLNRDLDSGNHSSQTEGGRSDMQLSVEINAPAENPQQAYYSLPRPYTIHSQLSPKPPLGPSLPNTDRNYHLPPLPDHIRMPYVPAGESGLVQRPPSLPRNGTIPRPRDFDGQSSISGVRLGDGRSSVSGLNGGADGRSSVSGMNHTDSNAAVPIDILTGLPEHPGISSISDSHHNHAHNNTHNNTHTNAARVLSPEQVENRQNEQIFSAADPSSFLAQLEERIPPCPPPPPHAAPQEANNNSSHADSDCPSSVASNNRKHHHHHHRRHRNKPSPRKWEEEFPATMTTTNPKPPLVYTFVNHSYEERVRAKLLQKQVSEPGSVPAAVTQQLLPRSVSAYNHNQDDDDSDSDSSSSDDSDTQLWHSPKHHHHHHHKHHRSGHHKHKNHNKKETSV